MTRIFSTGSSRVTISFALPAGAARFSPRPHVDFRVFGVVPLEIYLQTGDPTRDIRYLDRAALTMASYLDRLQQPNGLFFHAVQLNYYRDRPRTTGDLHGQAAMLWTAAALLRE